MKKSRYLILFLNIFFASFGRAQDLSDQKKLMSIHWQGVEVKEFSLEKAGSPFFGLILSYTKCRSICPMVANNFLAVKEKMDKKYPGVKYFIISADPKNDSLKNRKKFLAKNKLNGKADYLVSQDPVTRQVLSKFQIMYTDANKTDHLDHTTKIFIFDSAGKIQESSQLLGE